MKFGIIPLAYVALWVYEVKITKHPSRETYQQGIDTLYRKFEQRYNNELERDNSWKSWGGKEEPLTIKEEVAQTMNDLGSARSKRLEESVATSWLN